MRSDTRLKMGALSFVIFIMVLGNTLLFPSFPEMQRELGLGKAQLSWLVAAISIPSALLGPFFGLLADRFTRKRVIIPSLLAYGAGGLIGGLAIVWSDDPFPIILAGRIVQGVGSAGPMTLTTVLTADMFRTAERTKALGIVEASNGMGKVASPLIGGAIGLVAWYAPFFVYPIVAVAAATAVWWSIEEPPKRTKAIPLAAYWTAIADAFSRAGVLFTLVTGFVTMFALFGMLFWLSDFVEAERTLSPFARGMTLALPMLALTLTTLAAQPLRKRIGPAYTILGGTLLIGGAFVALPLVRMWPLLLYPLIACVGAGSGMVLPVIDSVGTGIVDKAHRGATTAVFSGARTLGVAIAPAVLAVLINWSIGWAFAGIAALSVGLGAVTFFTVNKRDRT